MESARNSEIAVVAASPGLRHILEEACAARNLAAPFFCDNVRAIPASAALALLCGAHALMQEPPPCPAVALLEASALEEPAPPSGRTWEAVLAAPLRLEELIAALTRRPRARPGPIVVGVCTLDRHTGLLTRGGRETGQLTEKERDILALLAESRGRTVPRRALLEKVWNYGETVETHTLETHIYRLRQKLEDDPSAPRHILTDGSGYRLD